MGGPLQRNNQGWGDGGGAEGQQGNPQQQQGGPPNQQANGNGYGQSEQRPAGGHGEDQGEAEPGWAESPSCRADAVRRRTKILQRTEQARRAGIYPTGGRRS
jgi:hypothetical protein